MPLPNQLLIGQRLEGEGGFPDMMRKAKNQHDKHDMCEGTAREPLRAVNIIIFVK